MVLRSEVEQLRQNHRPVVSLFQVETRRQRASPWPSDLLSSNSRFPPPHIPTDVLRLDHCQALHAHCHNNHSFFIFNIVQILLFYTHAHTRARTHWIHVLDVSRPLQLSFSKWWEEKTNTVMLLLCSGVPGDGSVCEPSRRRDEARFSLKRQKNK